LKEIKFGSHTQKDAEEAVGLKTDNGILSRNKSALNSTSMEIESR